MPESAFEAFELERELTTKEISDIRTSVLDLIERNLALSISAKSDFYRIVDERITPLLFKRDPDCLDNCATQIEAEIQSSLLGAKELDHEHRIELLKNIGSIIRGREN